MNKKLSPRQLLIVILTLVTAVVIADIIVWQVISVMPPRC